MKTLTAPGAQPQDVRTLLLGLHELRQSQVDPAFWESFCHLIAALCRARAAVAVTARRALSSDRSTRDR